MTRAAALWLVLSLGGALGALLAYTAPAPSKPASIEWLDKPRSLDNFHLHSPHGQFDNQSLLGHWSIVSFGFLNCPDICPTSLAQLATLAGGLAEEALAQPVRFIFVSVDPARDSVADVDRYARHFAVSFRGVTGGEDQLTQLTRDLGVRFAVSANGERYDVAHSTTYSIIDANGVFRGRFRPGFDSAAVAGNLAAVVNDAGS